MADYSMDKNHEGLAKNSDIVSGATLYHVYGHLGSTVEKVKLLTGPVTWEGRCYLEQRPDRAESMPGSFWVYVLLESGHTTWWSLSDNGLGENEGKPYNHNRFCLTYESAHKYWLKCAKVRQERAGYRSGYMW